MSQSAPQRSPQPAVGRVPVSIVCTVLNEAASIDELLASMAAQTEHADEIVIVDGGSRDGTWERLQAWQGRLPLRLLQAPGANIAAGRNRAIAAARGEIIAVTDAGVRLAPTWLAALLDAFQHAPSPDVVSGFFAADPRSLFELALGATTLPTADEVDPARFLPSSRSVAFRKRAWAAVNGYPEWLDYCEDLVFDFALRDRGFRFAWAPAALVYFRPRPNAWRFFLQYYRYARGDGLALLWTHRHAIRYGTYLGAAWLVWRTRGHPLALALLLLGGLAYCRRPFQRLRRSWGDLSAGERAIVLALIPALRFVGDVAKMAGYPVGLGRRWRRGGAACSARLNSATLPGGSTQQTLSSP